MKTITIKYVVEKRSSFWRLFVVETLLNVIVTWSKPVVPIALPRESTNFSVRPQPAHAHQIMVIANVNNAKFILFLVK